MRTHFANTLLQFASACLLFACLLFLVCFFFLHPIRFLISSFLLPVASCLLSACLSTHYTLNTLHPTPHTSYLLPPTSHLTPHKLNFQSVTGRTRDDIAAEVATMQWGEFKPVLAAAIAAHLEPIQRRYAEVLADEEYLDSVLLAGQRAAEAVADETLLWAKNAMGMHIPGSKN